MTDEQPTSLLDEFRAEAAAEAAGETVWEGADVLRQHLVPIESLQDHPGNPRKGDVAAISKSLAEFGQVRAILYDSNTNTIIAGHHVRYAARELSWTHVAAISNAFVDDNAAAAYLLVDNKLTTLGEMDSRKEYEMTLGLEEAGYGELPGYDIDEMETLRDAAGATPTAESRDWEGEAGESPEAAAARAAAIAQYEQHREVVLLLSFPDQYEAFAKDVRLLMAEYGTTGTVATIVRAVAEAAQAKADDLAPEEVGDEPGDAA